MFWSSLARHTAAWSPPPRRRSASVNGSVMAPEQINTDVKVKDPFDINLDCIHCGFCVPRCPTYQVLGDENDSPRGRIYLMKALQAGRIPLDETFIGHLDCCLGCRACETACPSGVRYEVMLNETRARIYDEQPPPLLQRIVFRRLLPANRLLRQAGRALRFYQQVGLQWLVRKATFLSRLFPGLYASEKKLPQIPPLRRFDPSYSAYGGSRYRVGFLTGCIMPLIFPQVHHASIEMLRLAGCDVILPPSQSCCGALHSHAGDREMARTLAIHNLEAFPWQELDAIIVNSAGCAASMKEWDHLIEDTDPHSEAAHGFAHRVKDICEFLAEVEPSWSLGTIPERVAYDDACHLLHGQQVGVQPRQLLEQIPNLSLLEVPNSDRCCGSAGIYNLLQPEMSEELLGKKLEEILSTKPDRIATANPGCILQIQYGLSSQDIRIPVQHPVELLYESAHGGSTR